MKNEIKFSPENVIAHIAEQTGVTLQYDALHPKARTKGGRTYVTLILGEAVSESKRFDIIRQFAMKLQTVKIEPNGYTKVAVIKGENW